MKGYVLADVGKMEWRDDVPVPVIGPYDAIVRPVIVAPCTSDVHIIETLSIPFVKGKVLGHEMAGIVQETGEKVKDFKPGDRVVVSPSSPNWRSTSVQDGLWKRDDLSVYSCEAPGRGGVFAELFHVLDADMNLAHLPDSVTWEQAVILTDMGTTAFEGVDALNIKFGDTVVVLGIGPVGLMAVNAAVLKGAARIFGIGSRQVCIQAAQDLGATDIVNYRDGDIVEQILKKNGGPVDAAVVCGGSSSAAIADALRMIKVGGVVSNVACFFSDETVTIPNNTWGYGYLDKTFRTCQARGGRVFLERLIALTMYGRLHPEKLVTHVYHGMEAIEKGLQQMGGADRTAIKPVVFFE